MLVWISFFLHFSSIYFTGFSQLAVFVLVRFNFQFCFWFYFEFFFSIYTFSLNYSRIWYSSILSVQYLIHLTNKHAFASYNRFIHFIIVRTSTFSFCNSEKFEKLEANTFDISGCVLHGWIQAGMVFASSFLWLDNAKLWIAHLGICERQFKHHRHKFFCIQFGNRWVNVIDYSYCSV